ncbi:hypothetical protein T492DRAFT_141838 [Pavlovales sp. CCMP2436]|nr:hypothetical protein T492DRAFT_141838 [Pavlovales sp. CCMP2436]
MKELEARNGELQTKVDSGSAGAKAHNDSMRAVFEKQIAELRSAQETDVELIAELKSRAAMSEAKASENGKVASAYKKKAERCDEAEVKLRAVIEERDKALVLFKNTEERAEKAEQVISSFFLRGIRAGGVSSPSQADLSAPTQAPTRYAEVGSW